MRKSGQVTVFLSTVLLCMCALLCSIVESARMAGARWYMRIAADSALDSVMAGYHREAWDSYRLLLREFEKKEELEEEFFQYFQTYFQQNSWYIAENSKVSVKETARITEEKGYFLEQEILDYMKYGIWTMDFSLEEAGDIQKKLKEAQSVGNTAELYSGHTKEALKVEEALEDLDRCLEIQREKKKEGLEALSCGDGNSFLRVGKELEKELEKIPRLVDRYEKQADALGKKLDDSKLRFAKEAESMEEETSGLLEKEIREYESYISKDGERRMEIRREIEIAEENKRLTEAVMEEAEEVEEYIADWEGDDEEDELDEEALWEPVRNHFQGFMEGRITCPHGVQDEEKKNILQNLKTILDRGVLGLVVPEGKAISEKLLEMKERPSDILERDKKKVSEEIKSEGTGNTEAGPVDRLYISEYCGKFFRTFLDEGKRPVQYELEYLVSGRSSDRENLSEAIEQIFLIREGMNLLHILSDTVKREEAYKMASAVVGASGLGPLVLITAFLIMVLWAAAEAAGDLRALLKGGKVPLWKTGQDWGISLENIADFVENRQLKGESNDGLTYKGYLKLLLLIKAGIILDYRMMDMVQVNIKEHQPDFLMEDCAYGVDIEVKACGKHVFFLLGIVESSENSREYPMQIRVRKAY